MFEPKTGPVEDPALKEWFSNLTRELDIGERIWLARRRVGVFTSVVWEGTQPVDVRGALGEAGSA